jgi:hypothetical protein
MFQVEARKEVDHEERQIEIIAFKREMETWASREYGIGSVTDEDDCTDFNTCSDDSCETIARKLCERFGLWAATVMEDGENGAECLDYDDMSSLAIDDVVPSKATNRRFPATIFKGTEAEGPHRGIETIFVPGDTPQEEVLEMLDAISGKDPYQLRNIYFGADNRPCENLQSVIAVIEKARVRFLSRFNFIWVELRRWKEEYYIPCPLEGLMFCVVCPKTEEDRTVIPDGPHVFFKEVTATNIVWTLANDDCGESWATPTNDPLFEQDAKLHY